MFSVSSEGHHTADVCSRQMNLYFFLEETGSVMKDEKPGFVIYMNPVVIFNFVMLQH